MSGDNIFCSSVSSESMVVPLHRCAVLLFDIRRQNERTLFIATESGRCQRAVMALNDGDNRKPMQSRWTDQDKSSSNRIKRNLMKMHGMFIYDEDEMILDYISTNYGDTGLNENQDGGVLDSIPDGLAGRVNLEKLPCPVDCPLGRAKNILFGNPEHSLRQQCDVILKFVPSSRKYRKFVTEMTLAGLCHKKPRLMKEKGFAKFFTVLKKVNENGIPILRTILDCQGANSAFIQPDPVNLSNLREMLNEFAYVEKMRTLDLRHFYHQVQIGDALKEYFSVAMGSLRLIWDVLPMGFTWSCFIAQAITTFAVAGSKAFNWTQLPSVIRVGNCSFFCVYDNILGGGPAKELDEIWKGIVGRLQDPSGLNAQIKEESQAMEGSSLSALGLEWFPSESGLCWCLLDKFVDKIRAAKTLLQEKPSLPLKKLAGCLGICAWGRYATCGHLFDLNGAYKRLAKMVKEKSWKGVDSTSHYQSLLDVLSSLEGAGLQSLAIWKENIIVYSDAHIYGYGFVGGHPTFFGSRRWETLFESKDMFFLEAIAAKQACMAFKKNYRAIHLVTDNMALCHTLRRKTTTCPRTALVLRELFDFLDNNSMSLASVNWIPTDFNPADKLSRGLSLDYSFLLDAHAHVTWSSQFVHAWNEAKIEGEIGGQRAWSDSNNMKIDDDF